MDKIQQDNKSAETAKDIKDTIIKEFGFDDLSDAQQELLVNQMTESVVKRVLVESYGKLSDSDRKIFEDMLENVDQTDPQTIEDFLRQNLTDYDKIVEEAIEDLKKQLNANDNEQKE